MAYRFKARSTTPGDYVLASGVLGALLSAGNVVDGVNRGDGVLGTYPTTATSQAAQLVTDQAAVTAGQADILSSRTILTITGTYHEATVAEVQDGVMFGPASAYEGTYVGTGATVQILGLRAVT